MSDAHTEREPDARTLRELSALADGSLEPGRAEQLRARIAGSSELTARYERERRAVLAVQSLSADRAPANLRFAIEARRQRGPRRGWRLVYGGALATSAAVVALLLILLLPGGAPGAPSISQAATLALRGPAMRAPASDGVKLSAEVGELYFPDWRQLGWKPVGQRIDRLDGQLAVTVYYTSNGGEVAYTILAAPPLRWPRSPLLHLHGVALKEFMYRGRLFITWRQGEHTCVLSGAGLGTDGLAGLAAWQVPSGDR